MLPELATYPHNHAPNGGKTSESVCPGLSSIHEQHGSGSRPRRGSRQHRGTGSESSIDPTDSLELGSSRRTSNSAHLDEFSDNLMKRQAHPIETEAVKSLLRMGSSASLGSNSSSSKQSARKKRHQRIGGDKSSTQKVPSRSGEGHLSSFHVESASGISDHSESRSGDQGSSGAGRGHQQDSANPDSGSGQPAEASEMHLGNTMRLRDMQPTLVPNAPQVLPVAYTACYHARCT